LVFSRDSISKRGYSWHLEAAQSTRILYGGSVKSGNIAGFMKRENIDGALVGGASLDVDEFVAIARFPHHVSVD